jgi:RHS repeat-associated protein
LSGFQYFDTALQFFPTAEGYVNNTIIGPNNHFNYVFNYTDHLGNIRLSYGLDEEDNLKIIEENNYYPFGLKHNNYNVDKRRYEDTILGVELRPCINCPYNYKYNGKELQDELGLNTYDYGFRHYMPDIGRWGNIDPLAELAYNLTPNRYCFNNPVRFIDPTGLWETTEGGYTTNKAEDIKRFMSYLETENVALSNSPSFEQQSSFIDGEMSAGGHGKLSDGSVLADELNIVGTKQKGGDFKNGQADKSMINFWHGVQRTQTPEALDPRTVGHNVFWTTYSGPFNPKKYSGEDDYSYKPQRIEDIPGAIHDLKYDNFKIKGASGLFTSPRAIVADWTFVGQELAIATLSPNLRTKFTAAGLGIGLGAAAFPKTLTTITKIIVTDFRFIGVTTPLH